MYEKLYEITFVGYIMSCGFFRVTFFSLIIGNCISVAPLVADSFWDSKLWSPIIGGETGVALISHISKSKTFPIQDPITDEFYSYSPRHKTYTQLVYGGFLGAEWQALPYLGLQLDFNYKQSSPFTVHGKLTQGVDVQSQNSYSYKYNVRVRQLLAEGKLQYKIKCFRPYFLLGFGSAFNRASDYSTTVPSTLSFTRMYENNTAISFSYASGVGVDIDLIKYIRLGVGYRFTDLGRVSLGSATIDGISEGGTLSKSNVYSNEFLANLTFVF